MVLQCFEIPFCVCLSPPLVQPHATHPTGGPHISITQVWTRVEVGTAQTEMRGKPSFWYLSSDFLTWCLCPRLIQIVLYCLGAPPLHGGYRWNEGVIFFSHRPCLACGRTTLCSRNTLRRWWLPATAEGRKPMLKSKLSSAAPTFRRISRMLPSMS